MLALAGLLTSHPAGTVAEVDPASRGIVRKGRGSGSRPGWPQQHARHWRFGLGGNPALWIRAEGRLLRLAPKPRNLEWVENVRTLGLGGR